MPLPRFTLADLTAEQMAAELLRRLPAHTPEWTNPQPGDPGRTLIELFAWLADSLLYRADLVPERQRLEFLRLLDIGLRPARPASGLAVLAPADPATARAVPVPVGTPVDGPVPFETTATITAQPFEGRAFIKRKASDGERAATAPLLQDLAILYGIAAGEPYVTTPLFANGQLRSGGPRSVRHERRPGSLVRDPGASCGNARGRARRARQPAGAPQRRLRPSSHAGRSRGAATGPGRPVVVGGHDPTPPAR